MFKDKKKHYLAQKTKNKLIKIIFRLFYTFFLRNRQKKILKKDRFDFLLFNKKN
jgi:hypothetical protein